MLHAEAVGYGAAGDVAGIVIECVDEIRRLAPPGQFVSYAQTACHALDLSSQPNLAEPLLAEALDITEQIGDAWGATELRYSQAWLRHLAGDEQQTAELLRRAHADAQLHGHVRIELYSQMLMALAGVSDPPGGTESTLSDLLAKAVAIGDQRQVIWLLVSLGSIAMADGDIGRMAELDLEALTIAEHGAYFLGTRFCIMSAAGSAVLRDDLKSAVEFDTPLLPDLDLIERSMPRAYVDIYSEFTRIIAAATAESPSLMAVRDDVAQRTDAETLRATRAYLVELAGLGSVRV